jgi:hypothetical protein
MVKRKVGKKLPPKYHKLMEENKLSASTVYDRINRGWDVEKAVSTPPTRKTYASTENREEGVMIPSNRPRGKSITFSPYKDYENLLNDAIAESGKSRSEFIADALDHYLYKVWQPKGKKKNHRRTKTK